MASSSRQHFSRNSVVETRSKHGNLFRRQCSLALSLASGLVPLVPCMALSLSLLPSDRLTAPTWTRP